MVILVSVVYNRVMITNILDQSFTDFAQKAKTIEKNEQRVRLDTLADYYTNRISTNETELVTKYAETLVSGGQPHTPDPRLYMRRDLLGLVQDSYALGIADALVDLEDVQFFDKKTNAEFALTPDDKLQRDIAKLQRDIQASQQIVRQTKTLNQYTNTLQSLQNQAQALGNTQATQTLTGLAEDLQRLKIDSNIRSTTKLINQQLDKGQKPYDRLMQKLEQEKYDVEESRKEDPIYDDNGRLIKQRPITVGDYATPQEYLVKRAIEEKLKYLENRRDSLAETPPVVLDEDKDFFRWYADKRLIPIANRYQIGLEDKNEEAKKIVTDYTQKINNNTVTQASKGEYTNRVINKLLNIEEKVERNTDEEEKKANKFNGSQQERFKRDQRPIKRVQRVVATELAIAYNVGRLKAYLKAGIQYVTISTSMYSPDVCQYCEDTAVKTEEEPIKISSLLKNAYRNQGFNKDIQPKVSDLRYLPNHPYCFVDGTMVTMYDILKGKEYQKNISEIVVGDYVKVPTKNKYQKVVQTHKNHYGEYLYKIRTNTGQAITTTGNHPLWDGTDWREAQYFNVGDNLFTHSFSDNSEDERSVRIQQEYKKCNDVVFTNESEQQVCDDGTESSWYTQDTQGDVNRKKQNQHQSKTTQLRSDESQQSIKRCGGEKENVSCNYREDATTTSLQQTKQTPEWQGNSLQEWIQRESRTLCEKRLGIQCRLGSSKVRLKVRVRESVAIIRWQNLSTRFLFGGLGCVHRSERLLDRGWQREVRSLSGTVSRDQNGSIGQQELSTTNQSFQGLSRVCIESFEKFVEPQFVYNISVVDDNMYFANGILSHNCFCYYKPHPKRDPEDKQDSQGVYADPNSWKFILGAGLGVSLVFLAFALTTGRKISVPTTIPTRLPVRVPQAIPEIISETQPQSIPVITKPTQTIALPPSQLNPVNIPFLRTIITKLDPNEIQDLAYVINDPSLNPNEKLAIILDIGASKGATVPDRAKEFTETLESIVQQVTKGSRRKFITEQTNRVQQTYDRNTQALATRIAQEQAKAQAIDPQNPTKSAIAGVSNSVKNINKTYIQSQLKSIQTTKQIALESYNKVADKTKSSDLKYKAELQQKLDTLSSMEQGLLEQKQVLGDIQEYLNDLVVPTKAVVRKTNKAVIQQQLSNTTAAVDRLIDGSGLTTIVDKTMQTTRLQQAQEEYKKLLELLVDLSPAESSKYTKRVQDLNRRIEKAQGVELKRFMGNTASFGKYTTYKYS